MQKKIHRLIPRMRIVAHVQCISLKSYRTANHIVIDIGIQQERFQDSNPVIYEVYNNKL